MTNDLSPGEKLEKLILTFYTNRSKFAAVAKIRTQTIYELCSNARGLTEKLASAMAPHLNTTAEELMKLEYPSSKR
jgi:plasmid maintenance system antidote protein VapI